MSSSFSWLVTLLYNDVYCQWLPLTNRCYKICTVFGLQGIIERDQIVFEEANKRGIPLFMLTSGGYQVVPFFQTCLKSNLTLLTIGT